MIVKKIKLNNIINFNKNTSQLNIVERTIPKKSNFFFKKLLIKPISINIKVNRKSVFEDIKSILDYELSYNIQDKLFYYFWIKDMANIIKIFSNIIKNQEICFSLETNRGCRRYHIDNVPMRLLVTYYGKGTEWLPPSACDYSAYNNGEKNENIIIKKSKIKFLNTWDIAIFKGKKHYDSEKGILHRTPDEALDKTSLLMRLDSFNNIN